MDLPPSTRLSRICLPSLFAFFLILLSFAVPVRADPPYDSPPDSTRSSSLTSSTSDSLSSSTLLYTPGRNSTSSTTIPWSSSPPGPSLSLPQSISSASLSLSLWEPAATSVTTSLTTVIITAVSYPPSTSTSSFTSTSTSTEAIITLLPVPHGRPSIFTKNPGALVGLIIGVLLALASILIYAWFTWRRHRLRQLESAALNVTVYGVDYLTPTARGLGRRGILDDDRSIIGASTTPSLGGVTDAERERGGSSLGHEGSWVIYQGPDQAVDGFSPYSPHMSEEGGYENFGTGVHSSSDHGDLSSYGHASILSSSYGHGTTLPTGQPVSLRAQSPPSAWPGDRSVSPNAAPSARLGTTMTTPNSRVLSRSSSVESMMGVLIKVNSDTDIWLNSGFNHGIPSVYPYPAAREDSPQPYASTSTSHTQPPAAVLNPPSSLLRPPSSIITNTLTLSSPPNPNVYSRLPSPDNRFMTQPSPAVSEVSVTWGREGLLNPPGSLSGAAGSFHSLRDEIDYSRRISGIINNMRDSASIVADSLTEREDNASQ